MSNALTHLDPPLIKPEISLGDVTRDVISPTKKLFTKLWLACLLISSSALLVGVYVVYNELKIGLGLFGWNHPVMWGAFITNFVFWIGIGHAGTLISAILFLLRQRWRTSINRTAEAMTIFAVMCAGLFPVLHVGRTWFAYWLIPYPNERLLWVNFRSPLVWDVFAVSTYFTISLLFWYQGLIPDFATLRDQAKSKIRKIAYGILSLGWTGSVRDWNHYEKTYLLLAGLATPLVLSVHSIVSFDFAVSLLPGWHSTIFPPYFVAGAIFSGMALVVTLVVIMRKVFRLEDYITINHLDVMNKVILVTSMMVGYAYVIELFIAWYSGNQFERFTFWNRATGPFAWAFWTMFICNVIIPNIFWLRRFRRSLPVMFVVSLFVNLGMWMERFVIIVTSLHRDFLPSSWDYYTPTIFDWGVTLGAFGLFFTMFLLFARFFPTVAMAEIKGVLVNPSGKKKVS
ncbi:MAG: polysulfide reductase NrfD [candidate division Zixibacteria bacterium]|nr:polysulfide reductase NrfD [candidate division Zixibacteria bacterium]